MRKTLKTLLRDYRVVSKTFKFGAEKSKQEDEPEEEPDAKKPKKSFWQQHGNKVKLLGATALAVGGAAGAYHAHKQGYFNKDKRAQVLKKQRAESHITKMSPEEQQRARDKQQARAKKPEEKVNKEQEEDYANDLAHKYELFFGRRSRFGNVKLNKEKIDLITRKIEQNPRKESLIKKFLYNILIKAGVKLGDYADYTLKRLISVTIKYLGPLVIVAMLYRFREPVYNTLVSKDDRQRINSGRPF